MAKREDLRVTFHVEPADRSVGIMSEGFSAWDEAGTRWCELAEMGAEWRFAWFDNWTGDETSRPPDAGLVEALLRAYVERWYEGEDEP